MLLDRIDIDTHGPLQRVELGPFSQSINVVNTPEGGGKTALARFLRDALVDREYPLGMLSSSTGRVVFANHYGLIHYYREQDGTAQGRQTLQYEPRGSESVTFDTEHANWLLDINSSNDQQRALASLNVPEAIADSVITDSAITDLTRVVSACVRSGLDSTSDSPRLPAAKVNCGAHPDASKQIRATLADIEAELANLQAVAGPLDQKEQNSLLSRRAWLTQCLNDESSIDTEQQVTDRQFPDAKSNTPASHGHELDEPQDNESDQALQTRLRDLHDRARTLRSRRTRLRSQINDLNRPPLHSSQRDYAATTSEHDRRQLQRQLEDIDAQVVHWQRAQLETAAIQQCLLQGKSKANPQPSQVDERTLRRMRLNRFLHTLDKPESTRRERQAENNPLARERNSIKHHLLLAKRQVDWLIERYTGSDRVTKNWYEQDVSVLGTTRTLSSTLRTIRDSLQQIHAYSHQPAGLTPNPPTHEISLARHCEQWLLSVIKQLKRHRDQILRQNHKSGLVNDDASTTSKYRQLEIRNREHEERISELDSITLKLDACLSEAAQLRRKIRNRFINEDTATKPETGDSQIRCSNRDLLVKELNELDNRLSHLSRAQWLNNRRTQVLNQIDSHDAEAPSSTLAQIASRWLIRLTGSRLRRIEWSPDHIPSNSDTAVKAGAVKIDGYDEKTCSTLDRSCAVLAVRMAAGQVLAHSGRHVPLVIETIPELDQKPKTGQSTNIENVTPHGRKHHASPLTAALHDYASDGHQLLILTSNDHLTHELESVGSRIERIHPERIVHPHRPLWKSNYANEKYVGPHPHTYGFQDVVDDSIAMKGSNFMPDANQRFDMAWQEPEENRSAATSQHSNFPNSFCSSELTDQTQVGTVHRDGYYYANSYSTVPAPGPSGLPGSPGFDVSKTPSAKEQHPTNRKEDLHMSHNQNVSMMTPESPFFLSVDSPIDQAPSIDAVAAARLRGLQVSHVVHLMQQDPCRLADALGLADVEANTIRRWQAECRLVCRVPNLRGFDARLLVACGITTPAALAATPPINLLHKVEAFLATDRGQQLLLSGSSHELARITGWIATANSKGLSRTAQEPNAASLETMQEESNQNHDSGNEFGFAPNLQRNRQTKHSIQKKRERSKSNRETETKRNTIVQFERNQSIDKQVPDTHNEDETEIRELRFYLQQDAPVVDAPSIGERMEERLQAIGIYTIQDLLDADPEDVAEQLDHRRVNADTVLQWQQQTTLVCCIPMLRGHDAQLLVAADIVTPTDLAACDADELFEIIDPIARSNEGKRILRGGNLPDLEEVTDWVNFAQYNRELRAA